MSLKDRVTIICKDNYTRILRLYGEIGIDDLERIVNRHIKVALDEIEEDMWIEKNKVLHCNKIL